MIPVLFESNEKVYTSNGIGRLTDCISCLVTEERNGIYECEFTYPITGINYDLIREGNIVVTTHDEQKDRQPFVIYRISRPISGVVTVNAHHVSYYLSNIVISPFSAVSVADAFNNIENNSLTDNPFTFWTDKASAGTMEVTVPTVCKSILGGMKGSILDSFGGGEYEWDKYTVKLYANRGSDNGVTIRYGKNLTDVVAERDVLGIYNAVIPYWSDNENTVVYGGIVVGNGGIFKSATWTEESNIQIKDENGTNIDFDYYIQQVTTMDLSGEFTDPPTVAELETRAQSILNSNQPWIPKDNIKVDFVALWQTEEYANIAPLERVQLCDTVSVYYPELGVNAKTKVIKVVWDALLDRYDSIELGDAKSSFAEVITAETTETIMEENISMMDAAINHATELITGGLGGHIVFLFDANGKPTDMLVMDAEDINTAVNVLRINVNGIGFSSTGVSGTYTSAWTLDGSFVADFITAGSLSANRIQGGTLTLGGLNNGNGILVVNNASGTEIGRWDKDGAVITGMLISNFLNYNTYLSNKYDAKASFNHDVPCFTYGNNLINEITTSGGVRVLKTTGDYTETGYSIQTFAHGTSNMQTRFTIAAQAYGAIGTSLVFETNGVNANKAPQLHYKVESDYDSGLWISNGGINFESYKLNTSSASTDTFLDIKCDGVYWGNNRWNSGSSDGVVYNTSGTWSDYNSPMFKIRPSFICMGVTTTYSGNTPTAGKPSIYITSSAEKINFKQVEFVSSSSERYKENITENIDEELDAHRLYKLQMKQFVYRDDYENLQYRDMKGKTLPGFIAEDVSEIYPTAVIYNEAKEVESWDERRIIPGMLKLIQEQHEEIENLKERISKLETVVASLMR